jgi:hypothetical protein
VTGSANWIGLPATPEAPSASADRWRASPPSSRRAVRYVDVINDHRLPAVTLAELRAEGLRHTFRLPS